MDITGFNNSRIATQATPPHEATSRWLAEAPRGCDTPRRAVQDTCSVFGPCATHANSDQSIKALAMVAAPTLPSTPRSSGRPAGVFDEETDPKANLTLWQPPTSQEPEALAATPSRLPDRRAPVVRGARVPRSLELAEIASLTGITKATYAPSLTRGRQRLRQLFRIIHCPIMNKPTITQPTILSEAEARALERFESGDTSLADEQALYIFFRAPICLPTSHR